MEQQPDRPQESVETRPPSPLARIRGWLARLKWPHLPRPALHTANGGRFVAVLNLLTPLLGMYTGQLLLRVIPNAQVWGIAVIAASIALLLLRLRPVGPKELADWLQAALGFLILLPLALNATHWKAWSETWQMVSVWLVACFFVISALLRFKAQPIKLSLDRSQPFDRWDSLALVLLIAGSLLLRVPNIDTLPMGADPDEASLAIANAEASEGIAKDPFAAGWATHPTMGFFVNGLFVRWFGRTIFAMRLPWAIAGALMVAALYLLARTTCGRRVALLAGVLAMAANTAIHFSRLGINNNSDALYMTWTLAALWIAGATGKPLAYAVAGAGMGFGQYFYFGNRAIPFVVLATLVVWLIADWRGLLKAWRLILVFALVTLVVGGPLFGHWLTNPGSISEHLFLTLPFSERIMEKSVQFNLPVSTLWWYQIRDTLLVFTMSPDQGSFYHPGQPMLHLSQAPWFIFGILAIFARIKRPFSQGLLAWMAVDMTLGSLLIVDAATFHRMLGVLPAGILVVAIGVDAAVDVLTRAGRWSPRVSAALAALIVLVLAVVDVNYYFRDYNVHQAYKTPTQEAVTLAALDYEQQRGRGTFLLCTHEGVDDSGKVYHSPTAYVSHDTFVGCVPGVLDRLNRSQPMTFYVLPDQANILPELQTRFPGGALTEYHRRMDDILLMTRYAVGAK